MQKSRSPRPRRAHGAPLRTVVAALATRSMLAALATWCVATAAPAAASSPEGAAQPCPEPVALELDDRLLAWRAEPGLEGIARRLAADRAARRPLPGIGPLEEALPGRPTVWLLRDLRCLAAHGLTDVRPDWVAGVAAYRDGFLALRVDGSRGDVESLPAVFRHELAHLALSHAAGDRAPRWLHEGYAQYAAGSWDWEAAWRLRFVFLTGSGERLRELSLAFPDDPAGARTAYLLSYTAVHELAGLSGERGLQALFARMRDGADVDAAMRGVFGITLDQFEERWRRAVTGRYGILYLVSRASAFWLALTAGLLLLGLIRRRRDRRKLERMREEERREAELWESMGRIRDV